MKSPFCYLTQNPNKPLCQPSDGTISAFPQFADFLWFCASLCDDLVTVALFNAPKTWLSHAQDLADATAIAGKYRVP
jgi:hypothetical protein